MLSLAFAATVSAAPCGAAGGCDSAARGLRNADTQLDRLTVRMVDLGDATAADAPADPGATESLAPLLFLAPRVTSILEDVFEADAGTQAEGDARNTGSDAEAPPEAVLRSPVAETDPAASAHGPSPEMDHTSILPKYQRQMYRTDI
ncbi:MAG TPA: hypothetical protein VFG91_09535 [Woeseiaceae bacterium]|nr:hypothetical protein [Woeseiaceae bacterium]